MEKAASAIPKYRVSTSDLAWLFCFLKVFDAIQSRSGGGASNISKRQNYQARSLVDTPHLGITLVAYSILLQMTSVCVVVVCACDLLHG